MNSVKKRHEKAKYQEEQARRELQNYSSVMKVRIPLHPGLNTSLIDDEQNASW